MKKLLVVGIIILFISVSIAPSINANDSIIPVKSKLVDTSIRIYRDRGITPFTLRLTERESKEVDRIFDNLKVGLDSAETGEEIDEIFDNAVESLYKLGMFPRMTIKEAKQLVNGRRVKNPVGNLGTADENFDCRVIGWTTETFMFKLDKPFWDKLLEWCRNFLHFYGWKEYNYRYYNGKIGSISISWHVQSILYDYVYYPSKGWVWTNGSNGVVKWNGTLYGDFGSVNVWEDNWYTYYVYKGVNDFEGLWIDSRFYNHVYFIGNAEHVKIRYDAPWL
jgi:hypothetical protein